MKRHNHKFKMKIAEQVQKGIKTRKQIHEELGIAPSTVAGWLKIYNSKISHYECEKQIKELNKQLNIALEEIETLKRALVILSK